MALISGFCSTIEATDSQQKHVEKWEKTNRQTPVYLFNDRFDDIKTL